MKRRVLVAQALVHRPPVIMLDEPTAGVDVELRQTLWKFISRLNRDGHTVVLTTHYLEEAEALCGRIAMLKGGRLVALDRTDELLKRHASAYLRLRVNGNLPPALLALLPGEDAGTYRFRLRDYDQVDAVLEPVRAAGLKVLDLAIETPDLEDVFVQTMSAERAA
jgi:ABC-2 type transport system ATP-binding protein